MSLGISLGNHCQMAAHTCYSGFNHVPIKPGGWRTCSGGRRLTRINTVLARMKPVIGAVLVVLRVLSFVQDTIPVCDIKNVFASGFHFAHVCQKLQKLLICCALSGLVGKNEGHPCRNLCVKLVQSVQMLL